ncbi:cystatin-like protein [Drosophila serrata]|uniref:cystatin-like protein n=1 Tax=Drosophila serrata TaxID=7274 RepID=UPI000A1D2A22|nr:cystatin-like protein [Drosophila serrata]
MQSMKVIFVVALTLSVASALRTRLLGAPKPLEGEELETAKVLLTSTLEELAAGEGPKFEVIKVTSATRKLVSGSLDTFVVELSNGSENKDCKVQIWSQPWLKPLGTGTNVKIYCQDDEVVERTW